MADKIYIKGNFLIAEDSISNSIYFKVNISNAMHLRDANDLFAFFDSTPYKDLDGVKFLQLGKMQDWTFTNQIVPYSDVVGKTLFDFADIVDELGVAYPNADFLDDLLNNKLGSSDGGALDSVAHDGTLTGDGTLALPLSVVAVPTVNNFVETWEVVLPLLQGNWHSVVLPLVPIHKVVTLVIRVHALNVIVGLRAVGSIENRAIQVDGESTVTMSAISDGFGQIEIFTDDTTNSDLFLASYEG